jgi:hypothetical protein
VPVLRVHESRAISKLQARGPGPTTPKSKNPPHSAIRNSLHHARNHLHLPSSSPNHQNPKQIQAAPKVGQALPRVKVARSTPIRPFIPFRSEIYPTADAFPPRSPRINNFFRNPAAPSKKNTPNPVARLARRFRPAKETTMFHRKRRPLTGFFVPTARSRHFLKNFPIPAPRISIDIALASFEKPTSAHLGAEQ